MKKIILSTIVVASFALYVFSGRLNSSQSNNLAVNNITTPINNTSTDNLPATDNTITPTQSTNTTNTTANNPPAIRRSFGEDDGFESGDSESGDDGFVPPPQNPTPNPAPINTTPAVLPTTKKVSSNTSSTYKDGTYVGSKSYAYSGNVQVTAIISNGKITNITFPANMPGPRTSQQIYDYSMPTLKSEAISAQSANINGVSGASYTSAAFKKSLAFALAQAKI